MILCLKDDGLRPRETERGGGGGGGAGRHIAKGVRM